MSLSTIHLVLYITSSDFYDLTHTLTNETFSFSSSKGGQIPYVSRQKKILLLAAEICETGPSYVAKELNMNLSTAYRELVYLEELNLVTGSNNGKRKLTEYGLSYINYIFE